MLIVVSQHFFIAQRSRLKGNKLLFLLFRAGFLALISLFVLHQSAHAAGPNGMNGQGVVGIPYEIEDCQDLQAVSDNLTAYYVLKNDIDCTGTSAWNGGAGFVPIGIEQGQTFQGNLDGNDKTINGLYIDKSSETNKSLGLFWELGAGGKLHNFKLIYTYIGSGLTDGQWSRVGGVVANAVPNSFIDRVEAEGTIVQGCSNTADHNIYIGGIVGEGVPVITKSEATVEITTDNCPTQQINTGGIIGRSITGTTIEDTSSYVTMSIDSQSTYSSGQPQMAGGLIGKSGGDAIIYNSFSNGSIDFNYTPGDFQSWIGGGLIGYTEGNDDLAQNFTMLSITADTTCPGNECNGGIRKIGAIVGSNVESNAYGNNYYDEDRLGAGVFCDGDPDNDTSCTAVNVGGADPNYFINNSVNPPLNNWNFVNVWSVTCGSCTPSNNIAISPYPDQFTFNSISIESQTSIKIAGPLPAYGGEGGLDFSRFKIYVRVVGSLDWVESPRSFDVDGVIVESLASDTEYEIIAVGVSGADYYTTSAIYTGRTGRSGFTLISTCQQLQDIELLLKVNYELGNNIDCSDTINWNSGAGFKPIGFLNILDPGNLVRFEGVLAGNNYTISNLYIGDDNTRGTTLGLFAVADGAIIQDVRLDGLTIDATNSADARISGSLIGLNLASNLTNTQIKNASLIGNFTACGGLTGVIVLGTGSDIEISKNSFQGIFDLDGTPGGFGLNACGGLTGSIQVVAENTLTIRDNYTDIQLVDGIGLNGIGGISGFVVTSGPLVNDDIVISSTYATGSVAYTATYVQPPATGGLIGVLIDAPIKINDSFSHLQSVSPPMGAVNGGIVGFVQNNLGAPQSSSNVFFDADRMGTSDCDALSAFTCTAISGQPNYFYNNSTNPPLNSWDFTNIWKTTSTLPVFDQKVLAGITEIPPGRLTSNVGGGSNITQDPTTSEQARGISLQSGAGTSESAPNNTEDSSLLGKIKDFLRKLPASVIIGFPYVLFGIIMVGIVAMVLEMMRQQKRLAGLRLIIAKQRSIAQQRDTFWHLAANYLRAPIALMTGGVDLLEVRSKSAKSVAGLKKLVDAMKNSVGSAMRSIETSQSLQAITWPKVGPMGSTVLNIGFWLPLLLVAGLTLLANYIASAYRQIELSAVNYLAQIMIFFVVAVGLYWVIGNLNRVKAKRKQAEQMLEKQAKALKQARSSLVASTVDTLKDNLLLLEPMLKKLTGDGQAAKTLREGSTRLRTLVDVFQLLINVESGNLSKLSPAGATTDLKKLLDEILKSQKSTMSAKSLTLTSSTLTNFTITGSSLVNDHVIRTVINNAIAFSPNRGVVDIQAISRNGLRGIAVSDYGAGVPKDQLGHIFEPFTKADGFDALQLDHEGLGVDLYISKLIMQYLGGDIVVESTLGQGTTMTILWPLNATSSSVGQMVRPSTIPS